MWNRRLRAAWLLAGGVALVACAETRSIRAYSGPELADADVARLRCEYRVTDTMMSFEWVDDVRVRPWSWWYRPAVTDVRVTPGRHVVQVSFVQGSARSTQNVPLALQAEAGHTYEVHMAIRPESDLVNLRNAFLGGEGRWAAWIVDADDGAIVSGHNPYAQ